MNRNGSSHAIEGACLLQIGAEVIPVYGNNEAGWSLDTQDFPRAGSARYETLHELVFVLINMAVAGEGNA